MVLIHGDAGLGKSRAVEVALTDHPDLETHTFDFFRGTTTPQVARKLARTILGIEGRRWIDELDPQLINALSQHPCLLRIEESQRLGYNAIEYLRRLHDHPNTRFGVVFVGGNHTWEVIQRFEMLESRINQRVEFQPLPPDVVVEKMPSFHPLLAKADASLLRQIDNSWGRGNFRRWSQFVDNAIEICGRHDRPTIDQQVAKNVFTQLGTRWSEPRRAHRIDHGAKKAESEATTR